MGTTNSLQGELQVSVMDALWRLEEGTVEDVRAALPERYGGAYTTVQTVLNRLAERGMLARRRKGNTIVYRPQLSEAEYLARSIQATLAGASAAARQTALAHLIGDLGDEDLTEVRRLAAQIEEQGRTRPA